MPSIRQRFHLSPCSDFRSHFCLYNYGPYSQDLSNDLDLAEGLEAVRVTYLADDPGGYEISEGPRSVRIRERGKDFLTKYESALNQAIEDFGSFRGKKLELYTTALLVARSLDYEGKPVTSEETIELVQKLKPYFAESEIRSAVTELEHRGFVEFGETGTGRSV